MDEKLIKKIYSSTDQFVNWLDSYGETSYDHQSFFAGPIGGRAKELYYRRPMLGIMAVAPMIFCEAFVPYARKFFWHPMRFPIADAHYAMGFAFLSQVFDNKSYYDKAVLFLDALEQAKSPGYENYCWGYPFNWVTRGGTIPENTPFITTLPYVYEAFIQVFNIDNNDKWLKIARSIAEHAMHDIKDFVVHPHPDPPPSMGREQEDNSTSRERSPLKYPSPGGRGVGGGGAELLPDASSCSYSPVDHKGGVINASAYRAFLLTHASVQFSEDKYWKVAERNLNFVLQSQQLNGSWYYAVDNIRDFVDHFHTCFVLKALAKIEKLTGHKGCTEAIEKGVNYYVNNLFDDKKLPKPFSRAPRMTVYRHELYDYAECINLCVLLKGRFRELDHILDNVLQDLISRWKKPDGSFRSRQLLLGWDNVPMHRWAQSQMFRSLCFLLHENSRSQESEVRSQKSGE